MKLLLTSGGVTNGSIRGALETMLGKPFAESAALFIPTAQWGQPACSPETVWMSTSGRWPDQTGLTELGWKSVGVLELTALPSIDRDRWTAWVRSADVLLVDGGEAMYLVTWMRQSGLADLIPELTDTVWVGVSAGSMAMTLHIGSHFLDWQPEGSDEALGIVDFSIFPHLDYPGWSGNTLEAARRWAATIPGPAYAIDEQTAISVVDGVVSVVSEGHWELLSAQPLLRTGARLDIVTIDAVDTVAVSEFWCAVLDATIIENEDAARWLCLADTSGRRLLGIQRTSTTSAAARPSGRLHLDLACAAEEFDAERSRILALGATETRPVRNESYGAIANFRAPDGTLFDLCAYAE